VRRSTRALVTAVLLIATVFTAAAAVLSASASHAARAIAFSDQTDRGRTVFANACAKCHGAQGQGDEAPRLIGTTTGLPEYKTAQGLFDYVSSQMPNDTPGSLKPEEYWDVLAYILDANKMLPPDTMLGPENAANISLAPSALAR
jgi:polar amino acid transport system substrate-binding protein